ncbi:MAG TPA: baseplate protein J [Actinomycetota bacterium]|jgi:hypothetical protein
MPIPLPNLDDRTYAELTAEARALIPSLQPAWTNHNPSDPGIVLVELLAWLTEMLLFQVNEVPAANTEKFLKLLNGPAWVRPETTSLEAAIRQTVLGLRERYRAATPGDYEWLALHAWPRSEAAAKLGAGRWELRRVRCVPRRDLSAADPAVRHAPAPAHVSLVVMPEPEPADGPAGEGPQETEEQRAARLHAALWEFFDARRILTTRHHVVGPDYLPVEVGANLALQEDATPQETLEAARQALAAAFHPLTGGPGRTGWPFGRAVYVSEVYAVLEQVSLVDYVEEVRLATPAGADRVQADEDGRVVGIELDAHELVRLQATTLVAFDVRGRQYR